MKQFFVAVVLAVSLNASAAWQKIGTVQVTDVTALVGGIAKLGEFTGNAMLGIMASAAVSEVPCIGLFGPGREKTPFALSLYWDGKDDFDYALLYPVAQTRTEFLAAHPGQVDKDGIITLVPDNDDDDESVADDDSDDGDKTSFAETDDILHVLFSQDGKWAALGERKEQLAAALKDVKLAERPMKSDLAKLFIGKKDMAVIRKMIADAEREAKAAQKDLPEADREKLSSGFAKVTEILGFCESLTCGLGVDDKGATVRGTLHAVKGSKLAQCGLKPLADNPFAFAGKDALCAYAIAADCGQTAVEYKDVCNLLAKYGIKTDFIAVDEKDGCARFTLDIPAAVTYLKGATNELENVDVEKLKVDFEKLAGADAAFAVENPAMSGSIAIKGHTTVATPAERIKAVLPEITNKKPYSLQIWSIYAIVKAVLPHVLDGLESKERQMFAPILATLPPEGKGGIVTAQWREKDTHRFIFRISADEFKSVSAGFSAFAAYQMQQAMKEETSVPSKK